MLTRIQPVDLMNKETIYGYVLGNGGKYITLWSYAVKEHGVEFTYMKNVGKDEATAEAKYPGLKYIPTLHGYTHYTYFDYHTYDKPKKRSLDEMEVFPYYPCEGIKIADLTLDDWMNKISKCKFYSWEGNKYDAVEFTEWWKKHAIAKGAVEFDGNLYMPEEFESDEFKLVQRFANNEPEIIVEFDDPKSFFKRNKYMCLTFSAEHIHYVDTYYGHREYLIVNGKNKTAKSMFGKKIKITKYHKSSLYEYTIDEFDFVK